MDLSSFFQMVKGMNKKTLPKTKILPSSRHLLKMTTAMKVKTGWRLHSAYFIWLSLDATLPTVDGRNPANHCGMYETQQKTREKLHTWHTCINWCKIFFHQQNHTIFLIQIKMPVVNFTSRRWSQKLLCSLSFTGLAPEMCQKLWMTAAAGFFSRSNGTPLAHWSSSLQRGMVASCTSNVGP